MATQIQTSVAWIRARDQFVRDLNEEEQRKYFNASPESLLDDASAAEKSHGTNSTSRKVMDRLQPFVAAIEQYGEAINIYSSTYSLALGPIWGSIKVLLHIAHEFGKYFDKLVDMFARIGDVLPRFRTYERLFSNHERLIEALSMAYLDIIIFCTNAKAVFRRGQRTPRTTLKVTLKLLWNPFDQQFGQQLTRFRQHQENVEKEAGLAHMIESADAMAIVLADQKQLEKRRREDNRLRILAMLNAVDYEAKHRKLQNLRQTGTGEWLFREAAYVKWKMPSNPSLLCCRGIPGCGKSILASNLIDNLTMAVPDQSAPASEAIYYYCDYADQRTLQLDRIFGSLLKQLFINHGIPEHMETQILRVYAGGTRSPAENALSEIFCSIVMSHPEIYIVFDGLDECEKLVWQAMLNVFKNLIGIAQANIKIFISCVEEGYISHHLTNFACVQISSAATNKDIRAFVTASVRSKIDNGDLRIRNPKLEQEIVSELHSRANGMFLWVFFQLQDLCESSSDAKIRETLRNLPEGLSGTYKRILIKINVSHSRLELVKKVFKWVTVAKRPLHIAELREAVGIEPDDNSWDEDRFPYEDYMLEFCRGLVIKDEYEGTVQFAHHTIRQYLTGGLTTKVDPLFEVSVRDADILAGKTCVAYLSLPDFENQITPSTPTARLEQKSVLESGGPLWIPSILGIRKSMFDIPYRLLRGDPAMQPLDYDYRKHLKPQLNSRFSPSTDLKDKYRLLCYAVENWEPHTRSYQSSDSVFHRRFGYLARYKIMAFEFRPWGPNQHFGSYGCLGCPSPSTENLIAKDLPYMSMIHYAAEVGNITLLEACYSSEVKIADYLYHERYHQETLLIACRHNRFEIVAKLAKQAEYDISDGRAVTAAAAAGHAEVLQYLFSLGQYPVQQKGHILLFLAAENGHEAVVEVLAEAGADVNAYSDRTQRTCIESAAMNGHASVIRILIQRGAHSDYPGMTETTALHLAAANGHVAAIHELLVYPCIPCNLNFNSRGQTALHVATELGHSAVAEELMMFGASPFTTCVQTEGFNECYEETPYHLAAKGGHLRMLVGFNTRSTYRDHPLPNSSQTALHSAAAGGHEDVIRWLVNHGADIDARDIDGETPLCHAIRLGNETTVRVLLELGAVVIDNHSVYHSIGQGKSKALDHASSDDEKLPILRMLLENFGEDRELWFELNAVDESLRNAEAKGNTEAAKLLKQKLNNFAGTVYK